MPYCTIEEAWANFEPFTSDISKKQGETNTQIDVLEETHNEPDPEPKSNPEPQPKNEIDDKFIENKINDIIESKNKLQNQLNNNNNNNNSNNSNSNNNNNSNNTNNNNKNYKKEIALINKKIDAIIKKLDKTENIDFFNKNIHDIILFIIFGLFLILVLDGMYKIILLKINKIQL